MLTCLIVLVSFLDLIDTLWNVKIIEIKHMTIKRNRFNRYIVECKVLIRMLITSTKQDLIDTLWNVKVAVAPDAVVAPLDLIDTLWNVKITIFLRFLSIELDLIDTLWNVKPRASFSYNF